MEKPKFTKKQIETTKLVLNEFKNEHKRHWLDFIRGMLWGYMHDSPTYEEAKVTDFEEWLND